MGHILDNSCAVVQSGPHLVFRILIRPILTNNKPEMMDRKVVFRILAMLFTPRSSLYVLVTVVPIVVQTTVVQTTVVQTKTSVAHICCPHC